MGRFLKVSQIRFREDRKNKEGNLTRIALVDDDKNIVTSLSLALKCEGFDVEAFEDGVAALEAFLVSALLFKEKASSPASLCGARRTNTITRRARFPTSRARWEPRAAGM